MHKEEKNNNDIVECGWLLKNLDLLIRIDNQDQDHSLLIL